MRKRDKKLRLHRETLHRLEPRDLAGAQGAAVAAAPGVGYWTSCIEPNCCGETITVQGPQ
jgi:hypothetical protein